MNEPEGVRLRSLPILGLVKVRDLDYFDGPLLSHFRHERGDHYLYYWCDRDAAANRWMMLRVSETNIIRLTSRFVPLDYVIPNSCQDDFVYFVDLDSSGRPTNAYLTATSQIPARYLPSPGAYLDPVEIVDEKTYPVLIERSLSIDELREFPAKYGQAYAFLYTIGILKPDRFEGYPWRGGFSAMHFYRWLVDRIPGEFRPSVTSLQYASPGFIRFLLHRPTAISVRNCVEKFVIPRGRADETYKSLRNYIAENKLNDLRNDVPDPTDPKWKAHDPELLNRTRNLIEAMEIDDFDAVQHAVPSRFETAKIILSFATRIRELAGLARDGIIRFPPV